MTTNLPSCTYWIDDSDTLVAIDSGFIECARAANAPEMEHVVGTLLWDHVSGDGVRQIYRDLFTLVRQGRQFHFRYRCDAPGEARTAEMHLSMDRGRLRLHSSWVSVVPATATLLEPSDDVLTACSFCSNVLTWRWHDLGLALHVSGLLDIWQPREVTHGVCPDCRKRILIETGLQ